MIKKQQLNKLLLFLTLIFCISACNFLKEIESANTGKESDNENPNNNNDQTNNDNEKVPKFELMVTNDTYGISETMKNGNEYHIDNSEVDTSGEKVTFTIKNKGTETLVLTNSIQKSGSHKNDFILKKPDKKQIAPGNSIEFYITFKPTYPGKRKATLTIKNNDPDNSNYYVNIYGRAEPYPDQYEPNDTPEKATQISLDKALRCSISPTNDQDLFYYTASAGKAVLISASFDHNTNSICDLDVYLDNGGDITNGYMAYNNMEECFSPNNPNECLYYAKIYYTFTKSGKYYILAKDRTASRYGEYWIDIDLSIQDDAYEPDNSASKAIPISIGEKHKHSFSSADDWDWSSIEITKETTITISASASPYDYPDCDPTLALYKSELDGTKNLLTGNSNINESAYDAAITYTFTKAGTYLIAS